MLTDEVVTDALRKMGISDGNDAPEAVDLENGRRELTRMLRSWQNQAHNLWTVASMTPPLVVGVAAYNITPRPVRIADARLVRDGAQTKMHQLSRSEYDDIPRKTTQGVPNSYYFDRQRDPVIYVWPVPSFAAMMKLTYEREIETGDELDVPPEWESAVVYSLAARLADDYERDNSRVLMRAERELELALAADREESVFFTGPDSWYDWR